MGAPEIKKVAVLGAGLMGSGIAAQCANAGHDVILMDIVPDGAKDRNMLAKAAIARLAKTKPAALMHQRDAARITPANLEDDLALLAEVDWICEAVIENLKIKHRVYGEIDKHRKAGSIVTSNTSTIPLEKLIEGQSAAFARDFAITHFFNPPRYMRLLELVGGPATRPEALEALTAFGDAKLGKQVVACKDTPGFIANRIGIYFGYIAMSEALNLGLTVEEADAIVGKPMGIPSTGIFGLGDLTGIDLAPHVNASMLSLLPPDDAFCKAFDANGPLVKLIEDMIARGRTGRKGGGGFYRLEKQDGKRVMYALDLKSGEYRLSEKSRLGSARARGLRQLASFDDKGGAYAWAVLSKVLSYAAALVPEVAEDIRDVDAAMRSGYAFKWGPFEMIDQMGAKWFADKLAEDGLAVPAILSAIGDGAFYQDDGENLNFFTAGRGYQKADISSDGWSLADMKRGREPVKHNRSASIWDVGDGVACLELHSRMNAIDQEVTAMVAQAAKLDKQGFKALIIGGDYDNFSVGADISVVLFGANTAMWPMIEQSIQALQSAYLGLKYAKFPVVAAVGGMALGGGCELALHCDRIQAHGESYMGLVEVGVGLIPGAGGCKELLFRAAANPRLPRGPMPAVMLAFESISTAKVGTSAALSRELLYLGPKDKISMNRARLLADAKATALALVDGYVAPEPAVIRLPGAGGRAALQMAVEGFQARGMASEYDAVVGAELAFVLCGGDTDPTEELTEKNILALERRAFSNLIKKTPTLERMQHMLETGKPLRN